MKLPRQIRCTYLLPILRVEYDAQEASTFAQYFTLLRTAGCEVLVVDGSARAVFEAHGEVWSEICRHVPPDNKYTYLNGKVNGVHTGVDLASSELIILADDDIRYTDDDIEKMCGLLDSFELVRPQNFLSPTPWWARIESARILINRGTLRAGDYPGTCGFRRSTMRRVGPYDGDVLFDNEELVRHFAVNGVHINYAVDFFILKRPPQLWKWFEQRPRQAYEDFVMRAKTVAFLSVIPSVMATAIFAGRWAAPLLAGLVATTAIILCARGLIRNRAYRYFSGSTPLWAPVWVLERSISVYWALYWRVRYKGYPFGRRLLTKGTGAAWIAGGRVQSRMLTRHGR
jgi:glycosyltransferase involved in cell wall biosynthesis